MEGSGRVVSGGVSSEGVQRDLLPIIEVRGTAKGSGREEGKGGEGKFAEGKVAFVCAALAPCS